MKKVEKKTIKALKKGSLIKVVNTLHNSLCPDKKNNYKIQRLSINFESVDLFNVDGIEVYEDIMLEDLIFPKKNYKMSYSEYLFSKLMELNCQKKAELPYDLLFTEHIPLYKEYEKSIHNTPEKSEYDCMLAFLKEKFK